MHAFINPQTCIGCTKCTMACPTGAIIGTRRMVHGVLDDLCHACGKCLPICPVSCITWSGEGAPAITTSTETPTTATQLPPLPAALQSRINAAREESKHRYTEQRGPLNQPKALRNKQAKP